MHLNPRTLAAIAAALLLVSLPDAALAYGGPGLGLGAIATALGVFGAILLGLISVLWYPFKRMIRRMRASGTNKSGR
jgi:hypothetical protein